MKSRSLFLNSVSVFRGEAHSGQHQLKIVPNFLQLSRCSEFSEQKQSQLMIYTTQTLITHLFYIATTKDTHLDGTDSMQIQYSHVLLLPVSA